MEQTKRVASLELMRILAMMMVLVMHYMANTGALLELSGELDGVSAAATLLESLCVVAVNSYVLLSGFFLSVKPFAARRVWKLLRQVLFYTLLIPLVLMALGVLPAAEVLNIYHVWNCLFPVQSGHYWFITAYLLMLLFSPVLNAALHQLGKKELQTVIGGLLLFFTVGKSLSVFSFATDRYGYDFGWFLVLYLLGGYVQKYGVPRAFLGVRRSLLWYIGSAGITAAVTIACYVLYQKTGALEYYFSVPFHYNYIFCLTGALGLFLACDQWKLPEGRAAAAIRAVSPYALAVYLIHGHGDVMPRWTDWVGRIGGGGEPEGAAYFGWMLVQVLVVYVFCTLADLLRVRLGKLVKFGR